MTDPNAPRPTLPRRAPAAVLQVIIGLVLGGAAAWLLIGALPIRSGRTSVLVAAGITMAAGAVVGTLVRRTRPAALAFAVAAAATCLLVGLVVAL